MNKRTFLRKILHAKDFFFVFARHLDEIFPKGWYEIYENNEISDINIEVYNTQGWGNALKTCLYKLHIEDCWEYYDSLDWMYSDELDADIGMLLEAIVFDENRKRIGCGGDA